MLAEKAAHKTTDAKTKVMALVNSKKSQNGQNTRRQGLHICLYFISYRQQKAIEFMESFSPSVMGNDPSLGHCPSPPTSWSSSTAYREGRYLM